MHPSVRALLINGRRPSDAIFGADDGAQFDLDLGLGYIRDRSNPANSTTGYADINTLLTYTAPSLKMVTAPNGLVSHAPHNLVTDMDGIPTSSSNSHWWAQNATTDGANMTETDGPTVTPTAQFGVLKTLATTTRVGMTYRFSCEVMVLTGNTALHFVHETASGGSNSTSIPGGLTTGEWVAVSLDVVAGGTTMSFGIQDRNGSNRGTYKIRKMQVTLQPCAHRPYIQNNATSVVCRLPIDYDSATLDASTTSVLIGTGLKSFTTAAAVDYRNASSAWAAATSYAVGDKRYNAAGRSYACTVAHTSSANDEPGTGGGWTAYWKRNERSIRVSDTADLDNYMVGTVDSYASGLLVVDVKAVGGSGTKASWHVIEPKGVLIEESRINIATYSEDFRNTAEAGGTRPWTRNSCTVAVNLAGPDGLTSASTVTENASGSGQCNAQNTISFTSGTTYTVSVFQRYIGRRYAQLFFGSAAFGANAYVNFDLTGLTVGTVGSAVTGYGIKDCGNGWVRIWCTAPATSTASSSAVWGHIDSSTAARAPSITLSGLTSGLYGFQVEAGSFITSPIPTGSAQVTRAVDQVSMATSGLPFSATEGTARIRGYVDPAVDGVVGNYYFSFSDGTTSNMTHIAEINGTRSQIISGGVTQFDQTSGSEPAAGELNSAAVGWAANDVVLSRNGSTGTTDASVTLPSGVNVLRFGIRGDANNSTALSGHLKSLRYIKRRVTNAELTVLAT